MNNNTNYENVKLEKSMYNLAGQSFTQALGAADPDSNYVNTGMEGTDAFQRQLMRFNINEQSPVESFFASGESAVLFPEYVRRALLEGLNSPALEAVTAAKTLTNVMDYRGIAISGTTPFSTATAPGTQLPETTIALDSDLVAMKKFGRTISVSYEAIRQQPLEVFAVTMRAVGAMMGEAVTGAAVEVLTTEAEVINAAGSSITYADLVKLWSSFNNTNMTVLLASPKTMGEILTLEQMKNAYEDYMNTGMLKTPFGALLIKSGAVADGTVIGLDDSCALEMIQSGQLVVDSDKLCDRQLDRTHISVTVGFSKLLPEATKVLKAV